MKKILFIEDNKNVFNMFSSWFSGMDNISIIWVKNIESALEQISRGLDFSVITIDACLNSAKPNTIELVKILIDKGYKGPIIANSGSLSYVLELKKAGATHVRGKEYLAQFVHNLL